MILFKDLTIEDHPFFKGEKRRKIFFDNGFGAIITNSRGPAAKFGTFELFVVCGNENSHEGCYTSGITTDSLKNLTEESCLLIIDKIKRLNNVHSTTT